MDENKEFSAPTEETEAVLTETDTENTTPEAVEEAVEEVSEEVTEEVTEETAEDIFEEVTDEADGEPISEKKSFLNKTIIISAVVVCAAVVIAILVRLFFFQGLVKTDLLGNKADTTWHYGVDMPYYDDTATGDEAIKLRTIDSYYEFKSDGTLVCKVGTVTSKGTYTLQYLSEEDAAGVEDAADKVGTPVCKIELYDPLSSYPIDGTYYYEVSGNVFTGRSVKLTNILSETAVMELDDSAFEYPVIEHDGDFKKDDAVVGSWTYKNESISETFNFNADGTFTVSDVTTGYNISQGGVYDCENGVMKIKTKFVEEQDSELTYKVEDNAFIVTRTVEDQQMDIKYEKN